MKWAALLAGIVMLVRAETLPAQPPVRKLLPDRSNPAGVYHPLNQRTPPGTAGRWAGIAGRADPQYAQPIRVELPSQGRVAVYRSPTDPVEVAAPAQLGVAVGHTYRLRISRMPEFPGVELYPSIEVLDRLHPPPSQAHRFPVPVQLTQEEIQLALDGRLVTKVVYLEQPQLAGLYDLDEPNTVVTIPSDRNLLAEADRLGRPMLILRLGGRLPDLQNPNAAFFGTGAPVSLSPQEKADSQQSHGSSLPLAGRKGPTR